MGTFGIAVARVPLALEVGTAKYQFSGNAVLPRRFLGAEMVTGGGSGCARR
jgi:hypothetical protein